MPLAEPSFVPSIDPSIDPPVDAFVPERPADPNRGSDRARVTVPASRSCAC